MLASRQSIVASIRRDAWVEVDLGALEYNVSWMRTLLQPATRIMGVVKGDAYGHGAIGVAELFVACGIDWFGVASVDEGCQLRAAGISTPILLLSPCPSWALTTAIESDLQLTVAAQSQIADVAEAARRLQRKAKVHIKVDSGMHRLGVKLHELSSTLTAVMEAPELKLTGLFSHLSRADDRATTAAQNKVFQEAVLLSERLDRRPDILHLASSDAARLFPETHYDMVRPGLALYGLEARMVSNTVKPAMSVRGRIVHLQSINAGDAVGYSSTWTATRPSRIASIPIGYADGVDRGLSNSMEGLLLGKRVLQVGTISMDQMMFDVTDVPQADYGDVVTLIGSESENASAGPGEHSHTLYLADWAKRLDTITYELACRLRARMPRIYTRHSVLPKQANT